MTDDDPVSRQVSTFVRAPVAAVVAVAGDPARLSQWAAGLAATPLHRDGDDWYADAPFGRVRIRFVAPNDLGVLDHVVTMPDGEQVLNPLRVTPWDDGCEVVFSVRHRAGVGDAEFAADVAAVTADLATLRALVEGGLGASPRSPADDAAGRRVAAVTTPANDAPADRSETRAELLPEERGFVQDPDALAKVVLAESDARTDDPDAGESGTGTTGVTGDDPLVSDTD